MDQPKDIAVIVGSLRKESINRKVAVALQALAPAGLALDIVEIGHLPLYNQDYDDDSPQSYVDFRRRIAAADAVLFVTPEHNRSMPAAMKNAVDIGSRPYSKSVWNGKPAGVISASPSMQGGFGANHHLRQSLVCLNLYCMPNPETYLGQAERLFDPAGQPTETARALLQNFIGAYAKWVAGFKAP
ncbi:NAD(P)H-dependent oxidoreductase [Parapusillimonas granuli]|uniref:NAD(P)H-dependent oxidoreductase n=1 Tax=Parapusillimonas granuli TaxID=380911 RepID=A0A853FWX9_9BURK|nr:chromate reductase [Parapusillimonas granuli]MEB2398888.1 NAD(P)H-dependent oxidoreductase [Alcaligenaceae bacterium]NYT48647.1 NAD(P)H-dependent oxidoreductase [Parapusillimonas granuli]